MVLPVDVAALGLAFGVVMEARDSAAVINVHAADAPAAGLVAVVLSHDGPDSGEHPAQRQQRPGEHRAKPGPVAVPFGSVFRTAVCGAGLDGQPMLARPEPPGNRGGYEESSTKEHNGYARSHGRERTQVTGCAP
jgi:hypothetical protein